MNKRLFRVLAFAFAPAILLVVGVAASADAASATYRLTFTGTWSASNVVPGTLPIGAHFTAVAGATHVPGQPLWAAGAYASPGIENVAEIGSVLPLLDEVAQRIAEGRAGVALYGQGIVSLPGAVAIEFEVDDAHSAVSFASMVAPSPDWFVGVADVDLRANGDWIPARSLALRPWDAGTEEGTAFSLFNPSTVPQQPISALTGAQSPFLDWPVIGYATFELVSVPEPAMGVSLAIGIAMLALRHARRTGGRTRRRLAWI